MTDTERIAALKAEHADLTGQIRNIDAQLSQKRKYDPSGRMWTAAEYHEWRARACIAKAHLQQRARKVKTEIASLNIAANAEMAGVPADSDATNLLNGAYLLLRRLADEGVDFDPREFALMDTVRDFLTLNGRRTR